MMYESNWSRVEFPVDMNWSFGNTQTVFVCISEILAASFSPLLPAPAYTYICFPTKPIPTSIASKYYEIGRMGYARLVHLNLTDRYSLPVWTDYEAQAMYENNSTKILDVSIEVVNSLAQFNSNGTINAIPIIVYHNIDYKNNTFDISPDWLDYSTIDVNLFDSEMKYLHNNGFQVLTMSDLGYNKTSNKLYIKNNADDNFDK